MSLDADLEGAEPALLDGLRHGDPACCDRFVKENLGRMLAVARRLLHDEQEAHDAVQDAFIQAFRSIHAFRSGSTLATWLHRIVVNCSLMRIRKAGRRHEVPIDDLLPQFDDRGRFLQAFEPDSCSAETLLMREQERAEVRRCIGMLPEAYRVVMMLRDIEELDTEETARALGITINAVKLRLHRARQALTTLLHARSEGSSRPARSASFRQGHAAGAHS